jgi:tRNA (guanine37-N1)-methyltransferase
MTSSPTPLIRLDVITIFPDYLSPLSLSLVGKAISSGLVGLGVHDLRDWTYDRHRTVDDTPYGGGAGMVMKPEPWGEALDAVLGDDTKDTTLVVPTPSGVPYTQALAAELATRQRIVFACGRYEGIDARVMTHFRERVDLQEISLGDYVLNGGEVAALAIIESVVRLLPGVIGNPESLVEESHSPDLDGLLEYPVFTKPLEWRGLTVPDVLTSGHHARISAWRREQSEQVTSDRHPPVT